MAGSSITETRTTNKKRIKQETPTQILSSIACVSDSATGLVPSLTMTGLRDMVLVRLKPIPDGTAPFTSAFEICIEDDNGDVIYLSGSIATDSDTPLLASAGAKAGDWPRMDNSNVLKIVDPADHTSTLSVGNSKEAIIELRFERRW